MRRPTISNEVHCQWPCLLSKVIRTWKVNSNAVHLSGEVKKESEIENSKVLKEIKIRVP
jgi:hypothetical protein